jgi:hypothetical protein
MKSTIPPAVDPALTPEQFARCQRRAGELYTALAELVNAIRIDPWTLHGTDVPLAHAETILAEIETGAP